MNYSKELRAYKHFCNLDNKIIYDIGANEGIITDFFKKNSINSKIIAIEPHPENYKLLLSKFNSSDINIINAAIGEKNEIGDIGLEKQEKKGGINQAHIILNENTDLQNRDWIKKKGIQIYTLDNICKDANIIKMDIEGFEHKVYKQFELLNNLETILLEIHSWSDLELHGWNDNHYNKEKDSLNKIINYFFDIGFKKIIPVKKYIKIDRNLSWNDIELSSYIENNEDKYYKVINLIIKK
tara:strand:+ start:122 stop:841 length:720 start_codon:yes stop_codon:yes gene_type:complete